MQFTDTHCHLYSEDFNEDRIQVLERALETGVSRIFLPNVDEESIAGMMDLVSTYPTNCFAMMGLHPCSVKEDYQSVLASMRPLFATHPFSAVGEIGIDLYWDTSFKQQQIEAFETQIGWAKELLLPIVIHVRNSFDEVFEVLDRLNDERLSGIFHCFGGSLEQANKVIGYGGFKLGLGGVLTFKKSGLDAVIQEIDMKHLVLETDAPYLAPTPNRGKRNEPAYVKLVAQKLAEIKGLTLDQVAAITTENSKIVFKK